jgi:predicted permease
MGDGIWELLGALGPVFALIGVGFALRRYRFPGGDFWTGAERLTYFVLFPALLISRLSATPMSLYGLGRLAIAAGLLLGSVSALLLLLRTRLAANGAAFSSVFQGAIRFNTYLGLAAASALFGPKGLAQAALLIAVLIPLVNILCVAVLARYAGDVPTPLAGTLRALVRNPLIVACATGIGLSLSGIGPPVALSGVLDILARAALPLGLLAVGAGLRPLPSGQAFRPLASATMLKLVLMPLLAVAIAAIIPMDPLQRNVLLLFAVLPGAPSAYLLARQMGGEADLMAAIVTVQTALALVSMPLMVWLLG